MTPAAAAWIRASLRRGGAALDLGRAVASRRFEGITISLD